MFGLPNLQAILLVGFLSLTVGGIGGFYTHAKFVKADLVTQMVETRKGDAHAVADAQATDSTIEAVETRTGTNLDLARDEIRRRHAGDVARPAPDAIAVSGQLAGQSVDKSCAPTRLSLADVRLFNRAYDGEFDSPTAESDAANTTPSEVTNSDFYIHHLKVTEQYLDLGTRHDALVSFVEKLMKEQRKKLGIE